jgi:hypothetical protein
MVYEGQEGQARPSTELQQVVVLRLPASVLLELAGKGFETIGAIKLGISGRQLSELSNMGRLEGQGHFVYLEFPEKLDELIPAKPLRPARKLAEWNTPAAHIQSSSVRGAIRRREAAGKCPDGKPESSSLASWIASSIAGY